jgi:hypothetical protein
LAYTGRFAQSAPINAASKARAVAQASWNVTIAVFLSAQAGVRSVAMAENTCGSKAGHAIVTNA